MQLQSCVSTQARSQRGLISHLRLTRRLYKQGVEVKAQRSLLDYQRCSPIHTELLIKGWMIYYFKALKKISPQSLGKY